tara:strand:+ start:2768 stop:4321 length:1554 start_codon:yes stop_codon:yes gene_type:complete
MDIDTLQSVGLVILEYGALLVAFIIIMLVVAIAWMYVVDVTQTSQTIRRNYPVLGRFRYFFEHLGEFFRQYFFALDREELPFNRAQRSWVYRAAKNIDSTVAFGSTHPLNQPGDFIFLNDFLVPLEEEVQPRSNISFGEGYARHPYSTNAFFNISAMSFGALSAPAISALSRGAKKAGIWLNTGEGAISGYHLEGGCDIVFQIGTAKYGVRDEHGALSDTKLRTLAEIEQVRMFEIKLSQGAKPGKGGILPGEKVTDVIATTRGIPVGEDSLSPNRHTDINCMSDLLDMIHRVREVTGKPVGIKAVIGQTQWLEDLCLHIHERGLDYAPDFFTVDSADGGTGAAPQSLIDYMGLPVNQSLPIVVDTLVRYQLKERIRVISSGKMVNPAGVAAALCLGADCVNSARGFMFALGCIQALQCNKNTCPTGITTHNEELQRGLDPTDKATRVASYAHNLMHEVEVISHSCGCKEPGQLNRGHAQVISETGFPKPLTALHPYAQPLAQFDPPKALDEAIKVV